LSFESCPVNVQHFDEFVTSLGTSLSVGLGCAAFAHEGQVKGLLGGTSSIGWKLEDLLLGSFVLRLDHLRPDL